MVRARLRAALLEGLLEGLLGGLLGLEADGQRLWLSSIHCRATRRARRKERVTGPFAGLSPGCPRATGVVPAPSRAYAGCIRAPLSDTGKAAHTTLFDRRLPANGPRGKPRRHGHYPPHARQR